MTHAWTMKEYTPGDEHGILLLRNKVFGQADPIRARLSTWRWQFEANPAGPFACRLAQDTDGRIVGQYAVIPTRMVVDGREQILAFSCDTMVDPDFQRQGMFVALAKAVYKHLETARGIYATWGFPNKNSMPGFVTRLSWKRVACFPTWAALPLPLASWLPCLARGLAVSRPKPLPLRDPCPGVRLVPLGRFLPEHDSLWAANAPQNTVCQVRDSRYLNWRYFGEPGFGYQAFSVSTDKGVEGYLVLRSLRLFHLRVLVLADMFPLPLVSPRATARILAHIRRAGSQTGHAGIVSVFPFKHFDLARKSGLFKVPQRLSPKTWDLGFRASGPLADVLGSPNHWHILLGDTDIV